MDRRHTGLQQRKTGPDLMIQRILTIGLYGRDYTIPPWWECFALLCKYPYKVYY
jgi:hypothetical protein